MVCEIKKIDSNSTGLRYAEEAECIGVLPDVAEQVWYAAEPNSYSDFGGQLKLLSRRPINASRQNQKGVITDLDASGGYNTDLTYDNMQRLERSFFFADMREQYDSRGIDNGNDVSDISVAAGVAGTPAVPAVKATGVLTLTPGAIDDDIVQIDGVYYQFTDDVTTGTPDGSSGDPHLVFRDGDDTAAFADLVSAINFTGVSGVNYSTSIVAAHASVEALSSNATTMSVQALAAGAAGNSISTTVVTTGGADGLAWAALTLEDGADLIPAVPGSDAQYSAAALGITSNVLAGSLIFVKGSAYALNNGVKVVGSVTADTDINTVFDLAVDEAANPDIRIEVVGYEFEVDTLDVDATGNVPRLVVVSGGFDPTDLNLVPGQFIYVGGDGPVTKWANPENNGFARVRSVTDTYIELDKTTSTMANETGTGLSIHIFFGKVIKNETAESGLIKRHSFQLERDLGQKDPVLATHQGEYLIGALANEHTLSVKQADKVNIDLTFIATDNEQRTQLEGLKSAEMGASAPSLVSGDAFNTSTHVARLRMTVLDPTDSNPTPFWGFCKEFTITIKNNNKPSKAVGKIGAFEVTAGQFDVGGKITAYFSDVEAVTAVRQNPDITFDVVFVRDNYGMAYDIPLIALGDGRLNVEQDSEIELPLDMQAAEDRYFHHTLLKSYFAYLPDLAMPE